ncbi:MAG: PfkB family carbohydrate kinase, partial [Patescibacteria group bacterium]
SLTLKRDRFTLAVGGKYVVDTFYEWVGGGGANVAVGLSRKGFTCVLWSEIGRDSLTKLIRERLENEGVDCSLLEHKERHINISSILLSPSGERTIINHRSHEAQMLLTDEIREKVRQSHLLYLGNMPEMPITERVELVKLVKLVGGKWR